MTGRTERRLLAAVVAVLALVPVGAGLYGVLRGAAMTGPINGDAGSGLDSHVRYLSGLLFGIGLGFWSTVPAIGVSGDRFRLLGFLVVAGGLGRLLGVLERGAPLPAELVALVMELGVTPLLCLWQWRVARRAS